MLTSTLGAQNTFVGMRQRIPYFKVEAALSISWQARHGLHCHRLRELEEGTTCTAIYSSEVGHSYKVKLSDTKTHMYPLCYAISDSLSPPISLWNLIYKFCKIFGSTFLLQFSHVSSSCSRLPDNTHGCCISHFCFWIRLCSMPQKEKHLSTRGPHIRH